MTNRVRVLVVDDSALMRKLIPQILERDPSIEVVGTAMDGSFGLRKLEELRPDVITMDLDMPRVDGMEMLRQIARKSRVPVIVVSSLSTVGASLTFKALALGAFDFVTKPRSAMHADLEEIAADLVSKVKVAAQVGLKRPDASFPEVTKRVKKQLPRNRKHAEKIIAIGISTGGPNALQYVLAQVPATLPASIVVVQHMPEGFTELFARRLDDCCAMEVKEAQNGDILYAGRVLIAPGNKHLKVRRTTLGDVATLSDEPKCNGHRPSADILFRSVAGFGSDAIGVIMTGMGEDGADALGEIKNAGGITLAQDERSCVVFGMPKTAIERGNVMRVVPLDSIAGALISLCGEEQQPAETAPAAPIDKFGE